MAIEVCPACGPQEFEQAPNGQTVTYCTRCNRTRAKAMEHAMAARSPGQSAQVMSAFEEAMLNGRVDTQHLTDDELLVLSALLAPTGMECPYTHPEAERLTRIAERRGLTRPRTPWLALGVVGFLLWLVVRLLFGYTVATAVAVTLFLLLVVAPAMARLGSGPKP